MARMTKKHRTIIESRLERVKQREGRTIMAHRRRHSGVTKREFHNILDKASQPIKAETESDQEQS